MRSSVVLPTPFGPTMPVRVRGPTRSDTSSSTRLAPRATETCEALSMPPSVPSGYQLQDTEFALVPWSGHERRGSEYLEAARERVVVYDGRRARTSRCATSASTTTAAPTFEGCTDILVETRPDVIADLHRSFLDVGVDAIETNSFGAFAIPLGEYGIPERGRSCRGARPRSPARSSAGTPAAGWPVDGAGHKDAVPRPHPLRRAARRGPHPGAWPHRGWRRPSAHRNAVRPARGQGGDDRLTPGDGRAGRTLPIQVQVTIELTGRMLPGTEIGAR